MGSMRTRLGRLMRKAEREMLVFELQDGTTAKFPQEAFLECLAHEWQRGREHRSGKPVTKGPHPLVEAVKMAKYPEQLMAEGYGTILMLSYKEGEGNVS
jgi:hypothetical protein